MLKPEIKELWVNALRSGVFKQTTGRLQSEEHEFCCLGVLCDLFKKETGQGEWNLHIDRGIFGEMTCLEFVAKGESSTGAPPDAVTLWAVEPEFVNNYAIMSEYDKLERMNDEDRKTFPEIADYIETTL